MKWSAIFRLISFTFAISFSFRYQHMDWRGPKYYSIAIKIWSFLHLTGWTIILHHLFHKEVESSTILTIARKYLKFAGFSIKKHFNDDKRCRRFSSNQLGPWRIETLENYGISGLISQFFECCSNLDQNFDWWIGRPLIIFCSESVISCDNFVRHSFYNRFL